MEVVDHVADEGDEDEEDKDDEQAVGRLSPGPLRRKKKESAVQTDDAAKENTDVSVAELVSAMDEVSAEDDFVTDDETSLAISSVSPSED